MTRRALALALLLGACGDGMHPMIEGDAGCGSPGVAPDQPQIACPAMVDLGCVPASGAVLTYEVASSSCSGAMPVVTCTPPSGSTVQPGTATSASCVARAASGAQASCSFPIRLQVAGAPVLTCAPTATGSCTGARSALTVPEAVSMGSCGGATVGAITTDAPAEGFALGDTIVTSSATTSDGQTLTCTTTVSIADDAAPDVTCPSALDPIVRLGPADPIAIDTPPATDTCDSDVQVSLSELPTRRGRADITATATDDAGLSGSCTFSIDVFDVFAADHFRILSAQLGAGGETDVTLAWDPSLGVDVTGYRLERATDPAGPFTELALLDVSDLSYTDAAMPSPRAFYRLVSLSDAIEGGTTPVVRALAIAADGYEIASQTVPTVPFPTTLYGVIRRPIDAGGAAPLVVFLHGNHGNCRPATGDDDCLDITEYACSAPGYATTPNAEGYVYLMESLAAQGFVAVSISANALNCRDDFILERTQLILEHLRRWVAWAGTDDGPFDGRLRGVVDPSRVSLVGHSRGGEAVAHAPQALRDTPIAGVALRSVFAIGPTEFHDPAPSGVPYAVLLPGCDADVRTLEGLRTYDRGLDPADRNARAQVLYIGANHNFFNTAWRFDDNLGFTVCTAAEEVGAPAQRAMLEGVLGDWVRGTLGERLPAYVRAEASTPSSLNSWAGVSLDLRWSYAAASRTAIDTFDSADAPLHNSLGRDNAFDGYTATLACTGTCARNFTHLVQGERLAWQDATATASWSLGTFDASAYDVVSFRFASRIATINNGLSEHDFAIRVLDASGASAQVHIADYGRLPHGYASRVEQEVLTTIRVPFSALTGVDPSQLSAIELEMPISGGNAQGSIWVADVDVASD